MANFEGCNIHDNTAGQGTFYSAGGGLYIEGTATLTNSSNVYSNTAGNVCSLLEPSAMFPPVPCPTMN
jgi:hypothetical protein